MEQQATLLHHYRRDRRKLLEFLLSSGLIKEPRTPSGPTNSLSNLDFDSLSADYIIHCVKSAGGVVDVTEATNKYSDESAYPVTLQIHSQTRSSYFVVSEPESAGSPPRRAPPPLYAKQVADTSCLSSQMDRVHVEKATTSGDDSGPGYEPATNAPTRPLENSEFPIPSLGLPSLKTGLSDDDLRESAYELLLASIFFSGVEANSVEDRRKEKTSKFLSGLKSKRDKMQSQSQSVGRKSELVDIVRVQMQISEAMDSCTRRNLMQLAARKMSGQIDLTHIALGLLNGTFKSDFLNERSYMQWKSRQANILEELLCSATGTTNEHLTIRSYVAKIRDEKEWDTMMSASERVAVVASMRQVAVKLSSLPAQFGIQGETFYWTAIYHVNIRLYQKLLFGLFDVLDEDQLIEEADEMLLLIKLTWSTLGITETMHDALYGWVLFQQFVRTGGSVLLENAVLHLQKVLSTEEDDRKEQYMNSLVCTKQCNGSHLKLHLLQSIFVSISMWCDYKLQDYHSHFSQKPYNFRMIISLVSAVGVLASDESGDLKLMKLNASDAKASRKLKSYVKKSTEAAFRKKPFLKGVSSVSGDARSVLPAAYMLDQYLTKLYTSALEANKLPNSFNQDFKHYQIGEISKPFILDWVISQHSHILEWTGRAFDIEDWEPLSYHQRHAASIVEVFRIIEETVDQLFGFNLPMDITHLQALLSVIFHSLDAYLMKMLNQLVEKNHLYPSAPPITRYAETVIPMIKRSLVVGTLLDENVARKLNELTIPKLCIRLNTLQYIQKQVAILEDGIRKSWGLIRPSLDQRQTKEEVLEERSLLTSSEAVDALFATTCHIIRDTTTDAIRKFCDFTGARVVFWDLRDQFLFHLYRGDVGSSRLESFLPHVDTVLDHICGLIDDTLRDLVVLSICRASLEGYVWVLLDGGPSRAFSDSDITMMEDDLNVLKEFFVAEGEGLPRSLVEQEAKFAQQILGLFSLKTETVIRMLMNASEHISIRVDSQHGHMGLEDAHTLVRVLCHKKDREASKFLKQQYELPMSSEYDDTSSRDSNFGSPLIPDLLKRSTSFHWPKNGQSSFKSIRKKLQAATSEIRDVAR
ncbi:protein unc-13 homolog isoform X5 [Populus trichocarpa]|uniref:protein unc-13 homolog isoform X5 n=1 Tax=Populus trichocarpa TaxID=3694 RepID=UPI002278ADAF|nr:protein unc-13 homolog isoform X5 [Populus trichocarpa]